MHSIVRWLVDVTFKPPHRTYDSEKTVSVVTNGENVYVRKSFSFPNDKGNTLYGSLWYDKSSSVPKNCLIYLHSLGTNQFECLNLIPLICSTDVCLVAFDLPGCGNSEGGYIPLDGSGLHDVDFIIKYLDSEFHFEKYSLWGRSLGAAIALQSVSNIPRFSSCVSDSSFKDTESVVYDQAVENNIPKFVITFIEPIIKYQANKILNTNIISPSPLRDVPFATTPLLMGHGKLDTFVPIRHAKTLFNAYGCGDKQLYVFDSRHNGVRPYQWYETAARFIYRKFGLKPLKREYTKAKKSSYLHSGSQEVILEDIENNKKTDEAIEEEESKEINNKGSVNSDDHAYTVEINKESEKETATNKLEVVE